MAKKKIKSAPKKAVKKPAKKTAVKKDNFTKACEFLKEKAVLPDVSMLKEKDQLPFISLFKITKIIEAQNKKDKYVVDFHSQNAKYFPWPEVAASAEQPGGFGFSSSNYFFSRTSAYVGARLCVKDSKTALRIFEENKELYKNWLLIPTIK